MSSGTRENPINDTFTRKSVNLNEMEHYSKVYGMISADADGSAMVQKQWFNDHHIDKNYYTEKRFRFNGKSVIINSST